MFLTLHGQNLVAIVLINAKLCMNVVVGTALSLVIQRKNYNAPKGGATGMLYCGKNIHICVLTSLLCS